MTDDTPQPGTSSSTFALTPQQIAVIGTVIAFIAGLFASRGLISKSTAEYLAGPEAMTALSGIVAAGAAIYQLIKGRPHELIRDTNRLAQVDAVIVKPKTAGEIDVPGIVGSVDDAAKAIHRASAKRSASPH